MTPHIDQHSQFVNGDIQRKVLVTGAAGFGGSNLTGALLREGYSVTGLDITPPASASLLSRELRHPSFQYLWKSVQDIQPSDVEGHSIVVHMAAQADTPMAFDSPRYTVMQNVLGTAELLEAVRHTGCVSNQLYA
ncbi:MAG: GDP-mannose 4,6-dehydratase, partial [Dehalococcoidia bacterium]|nr:GDP-mannose 4,6-dehydratase [Dehalococcoidia bacterium]